MNLEDKLRKVSEHSDSSSVGKKNYDSIETRIKEEEYRRLKLENDAIEGYNIGDTQDRDQRKDFAERIYYFASVYLIFVFLILFLSGSRNSGFCLDDSVLDTLLKTTTANVIGILAIVVTYLFSRKKK